MLTPRFLGSIVAVGVMVLGAGGVLGQDYPTSPIRITTGTGSTELLVRLVAQGISAPLGQPVVVEIRGGVVANETVAKAPPDGYLTLVTGGSIWLQPLTRKTSWDPVTDFVPISILAKAPNVLYASLSLPVKSVKELIALAKAKPGSLSNSVGQVGGVAHLSGELFKSMAGVNIVAVPYSSDAVELGDLISGRVQLTITSPTLMMEQVKLGKLRALAVTGLEPSALAPDLPTIAASGLSGYESVQLISMFAPAKTPGTIVNRLNQEIVRFLNQGGVKEKVFNAGLETVGSSPAELAATIKSEMARWGKLIKDLGIKAE